MKKIGMVFVLFLGLFLITGCVGEDEIAKQAKEDAKLETLMEVNQTSEKEFTITVQNGQKGTSERGILVLEDGEDVSYDYSFHGIKNATVYFLEKGKTKEDALMYDLVSGEGNSISSDVAAGEYELLFEVEDDSLTGTFTARAVKSEEN